MKGFKKLLLFLVLPIILMSCDRKPDLAYEDACVHPNALKEIKYYVWERYKVVKPLSL